MNLHGKNFIADQLSTGTGQTVRPVSPGNSQPLDPPFYQAGPAEVEAALNAAEAAFVTYRHSTGADRAVFLERIGAEILALGDTLIERAQTETGLPKARLEGERARTVGQLRLFAELVRDGSWVDARLDSALPDRQPLPRPDLRRMLIPLGPVAVFGSSNFPLAFSVAGGDTASALAAGCPVVVKAHRGHPGTSELVATAVRAAVDACRLPAGVFSLLHGSGAIIGTALVKHPHTRAAGFTGSRAAGRALFDAAAARPDPIPVFAEMSSLNPVFLLPGALRERGAAIAEELKQSFTLGVGQFCTKPGLVFAVTGPDLNRFADAFAQLVQATMPATMLHGEICAAFHEGVERAARVSGVELLARSQSEGARGQTHGVPVVWRTDAVTFLRQPQLAEEVFGPFTIVVSVSSLAELETVARHLDGQLTATIHGSETDLHDARALVQVLERKAGRVVFNGFPAGVEVSPAMQHGGPYPATTDARFTSVGTAAILRFVRPICYQNAPASCLPSALQDANPLGIRRLVNGKPA